MNAAQLALLDRLKALRESRAAGVSSAAAMEAEQAASAAERAHRMARSFATLRQVRAGAIARRLGAGPSPPGQVMAAQAELLDMAARAGVFAARATVADNARAEADQRRHQAAQLHQAELRRLEAWRALIRVVTEQEQQEAERAAEAVLEEAVETRLWGRAAWTA